MKHHLNYKLRLLSLILFPLLINSCGLTSYEKIYPTLSDGKYDSEFPYRGSSDKLQEISLTVKRINSTGFYKTYVFSIEDSITIDDIRKEQIDELASESGYADQSTSGTGTIIYSSEGKVAVLTCAHVVNYPDTVLSFFSDPDGNISKYLDAVLILDEQAIYVAGFPEGSRMEIIALDPVLDIALIGRDYHILQNYFFPVFNYPSGKAKELDWGTFVYVFGYPVNYQMITKALVSNPNRDGKGTFLIDAVINQGYSGGIVLAIKDGIPNFELVGIVQWVPEEEQNIIIPVKRKDNMPYSFLVPYKGELFVKRYSSIRYGISKIISMESILDFINDNKDNLYDKGYYLDKYINN